MLHVGAKCQHLSCNAGHCYLAHGVHWDAVFIHMAPQRDMPSRPSPFLKPSQNKEREYSHLKSVSRRLLHNSHTTGKSRAIGGDDTALQSCYP